jgi:hypothetical protein
VSETVPSKLAVLRKCQSRRRNREKEGIRFSVLLDDSVPTVLVHWRTNAILFLAQQRKTMFSLAVGWGNANTHAKCDVSVWTDSVKISPSNHLNKFRAASLLGCLDEQFPPTGRHSSTKLSSRLEGWQSRKNVALSKFLLSLSPVLLNKNKICYEIFSELSQQYKGKAPNFAHFLLKPYTKR